MKKLIAITLLVFAGFAIGQAPADPKVDPKDGIQFPSVVEPKPPNPPQQVTKLSLGQLYVITSPVPSFVLASPSNLVTITEEAGPLRIRGVFVDGNGKTETRTFTQKQVFIVEAAGTGTVELMAVVVGKTKASDVIRKTIDVDNGVGPRPPPDPPKPPTPPDPPTPAPIPLAGFRTLIVYDPVTLTPAQQGIVFGAKVRSYLQSKCVVGGDGKTKDFWILQSGVDVSSAPKWVGDAIQRHPGQKTFMLVSDGKTGYDGVIPASADEALSIMQKTGGQ